VFDYTNGFHDAANSIATVVSTRVLSPGAAVSMAAFFNFIAFAVFGDGRGENHRRRYGQYQRRCRRIETLRFAGGFNRRHHLEHNHLAVGFADIEFARARRRLRGRRSCGARRVRNFVRQISGFLTGDTAAGLTLFSGFGEVLKAEGWIKTLSFILLSPLIGATLGFLLMVAVFWIFTARRFPKLTRAFASDNCFPPLPTRSDTAATTRKRRWALLQSFSSQADFCK
jgi:PiT family inorganic phosphate transporter